MCETRIQNQTRQISETHLTVKLSKLHTEPHARALVRNTEVCNAEDVL